MAEELRVRAIGGGAYRVERDGRAAIVYVAGERGRLWAFSEGHVYRGSAAAEPVRRRTPRGDTGQSLTSPMPATVIKVLVEPGAAVKKGDTVLVLEAMKMELPIRATGDGTVVAVHCRQGELVQPDTPLVDIGS